MAPHWEAAGELAAGAVAVDAQGAGEARHQRLEEVLAVADQLLEGLLAAGAALDHR